MALPAFPMEAAQKRFVLLQRTEVMFQWSEVVI